MNNVFTYTTPNGNSFVKDLGVNVSDDLSWTPHINIVTDNAIKITSWAMGSLKTEANSELTLLQLFKSLIRS